MKMIRMLIIGAVLVAQSLLPGGLARAGEETPANAEVAKSLETMATEAKAILSLDNIHNTFDLYRKLKDYGLAYQGSLTAPNDVVDQLGDDQLRIYAGFKLLDALYAVTFMKRQEVADCIEVIEKIQEKLDLRSYADISNTYLTTLKKAAEAPEDVDVQKLIEQLSADYVSELPSLLSNPESAAYLIDGLYGMLIEMNYIEGMELATASREQIEKGLEEYNTNASYKMVLDLFQAFDRMEDTIRVRGKTEEKLAVVREMFKLVTAEREGRLPDSAAESEWMKVNGMLNDVRTEVLSPVAQ